jgi:multidrug efflux pump subunit AcrA (membrane-fusion protein)
MVLAGLAVGVGVAALFVANRQGPEQVADAARVADLRVIEVRPLPFRVEARGHGEARPAETWQAVANVAGRVVERHPGLESGILLREGTLLLALDPSRYELAIAEAEAELASLAAELAQLDTEEENTGRLLVLEREALALAQQELSRIERLAVSGSVSTSRRDEQRRSTVAQRRAVASLENQRALVAPRRRILEAQRDRTATRRDQALRDLEDTRFVAPYDLRVSQVGVEMHQYAGAGQRLFQAESLEAAEVEVHVPLSMLRGLLAGVVFPEGEERGLDIGERGDLGAVSAEVALVGAAEVRWPARLVRVSSGLDPVTRTARVVVRVDHPYRHARPPDHPPLQRDMYVRVRLTAADDPRLVVPAAAVHDGEVYRLDAEDRLRRVAVEVAFEQHDMAIIASGLAAGDRVIVDDPIPALDGMRVAPRRDTALEARLRDQAAGEAP